MKVRAILELDISEAELADPALEKLSNYKKALVLALRKVNARIKNSYISPEDFDYKTAPEPLILEPEDYPGEQWDLLCKVFGTPGASSIKVENYDISAFYEVVDPDA